MNLAPVRLIALNTFQEALRLRFLNVIWILAILLIASSLVFRQVHFGGAELRFLFDFGHGAIFIFGAILSIFITSQLFFRELDHRTALMILSRPVRASSFLVGKFLGIVLVMTLFTVVMGLILSILLAWRSLSLPQDPHLPETIGFMHHLGLHLAATLLQWVKFILLGAMVFCVCCFATSSLFAMFSGLALLVICQLQHIALSLQGTAEAGLTTTFVALAGRLFPDFSVLNPENLASLEGGVPGPAAWLSLFGYALIYLLAYLLLAVVFFKRREI